MSSIKVLGATLGCTERSNQNSGLWIPRRSGLPEKTYCSLQAWNNFTLFRAIDLTHLQCHVSRLPFRSVREYATARTLGPTYRPDIRRMRAQVLVRDWRRTTKMPPVPKNWIQSCSFPSRGELCMNSNPVVWYSLQSHCVDDRRMLDDSG